MISCFCRKAKVSQDVWLSDEVHIILSDIQGSESLSWDGSFLAVKIRSADLAPVVEVDLLPGGEVVHQWASDESNSWNMIGKKSEQEDDLSF